MLRLLESFFKRSAARRADREREESVFLRRSEQLVVARAQELEAAGLASFEIDRHGGDAPPSVDIHPRADGAARVWVGFDFPTFCVWLPHASRPTGYEISAELFGDLDDRLDEIGRRLDAIVAGRLEWAYTPGPAEKVEVRWLDERGEPFLEATYRGAGQGGTAVAGRAAPYA
ncbi:MAG: hypothetical protein PGN13_11570 [Patulibacter minatonensis]